ncbi:MAG: CheR family methyltransferase [Acidobacteriota bacterium]
MANAISDSLLSQLSRRIADLTGMHFPQAKWRDLARAVETAAAELGFQNAEAVLKWLETSTPTKEQIGILASHLTVGETYFFRDQKSFEILEQYILPALLESRRASGQKRLRIWSAACASGEEPYSLAILLKRMLPDLQDWHITILATDINQRALQKAMDGNYSEWSFRDAPPWLKERYFNQRGSNRYEILKEIQQMVTFDYLNLTEDFYPALLNQTNAMDVIFCRNVLIYFVADQAGSVIHKFYRALTDGGWLITSPMESAHLLNSEFKAVSFEGATFYQKASGSPKPSQAEEPFTTTSTPFPPQTPAEMSESLWSYDSLSGLEPPRADETTEVPAVQVEESLSGEAEQDRYGAARSLYEQGRYAEVKANLLNASSPDDCTVQELALLARSAANEGNLAEALEWCEQAIVADKFDAGLRYLRATILQEQERVDDAIASLKRALYLNQHFALAHFALGGIARRLGRTKEAAKYFHNALGLLRDYHADDPVPEAEGLTAAGLIQLIQTMSQTATHRGG